MTTDEARKNRAQKRKILLTPTMIQTCLLRHIATHGPTNWSECKRATGVSMPKTREAGYWLAGRSLITWPPNIHSRIVCTEAGKLEAEK